MADHAALRDAETLLAEATALLTRIGREIQLLTEACASGEADLERLERLASEAAEHVAWLGGALEEGRRRQGQLGEGLQAVVDAAAELEVLRVETCLKPPALHEVADAGGDSGARAEAILPRFDRLRAVALTRTEPRPRQLAAERWDLMAKDFPSFEESYQAALDLLVEAEGQAERAAERRPPVGERDRERPRSATRKQSTERS